MTFDDGVGGKFFDETAVLVCVEVKVQGVCRESQSEEEEEVHGSCGRGEGSHA